MNKMKVIDLLNKIANGEEVPKKIRIDHWCYNFKWKDYAGNYVDEHEDIDLMSALSCDKEELNYEVHSIEEPQEHKIPLKINKIIPSQNYVISDSKNHSVDERLEIIRKRLYANELYMLDIANTLNEIIDYLEENK